MFITIDDVRSEYFRATRKAEAEAYVGHIQRIITEEHMKYLFSMQWKAISFQFIFRRAERLRQAEQQLKSSLKKMCFSGHCIYGI